MPTKTVITVNSSGRQAASFIRVASAVGWKVSVESSDVLSLLHHSVAVESVTIGECSGLGHVKVYVLIRVYCLRLRSSNRFLTRAQVRAQMRDRIGIVAEDICDLENVTVIEGSLESKKVIKELFSEPAEVAFINTTHWGNELAIGKALVDAAVNSGVQHLIYSSMPDHSLFADASRPWRGLPMWTNKFVIEQYIRSTGISATFLYCGIYHNNFTSLPYPLFRMELQGDESFEWQAPFDPDVPLPWLDAEHDVGPVVLQIFKDGPSKWAGQRCLDIRQ
jgi:hypothetical protein